MLKKEPTSVEQIIKEEDCFESTCDYCGCIIMIPNNEEDRTRLDEQSFCSTRCSDRVYNSSWYDEDDY